MTERTPPWVYDAARAVMEDLNDRKGVLDGIDDDDILDSIEQSIAAAIWKAYTTR